MSRGVGFPWGNEVAFPCSLRRGPVVGRLVRTTPKLGAHEANLGCRVSRRCRLLAAGLFPSAVADAAVPGVAFSGTSTHGKFDVTATPECSAASPLPPVLTCSQATYLDFVATPTAKAGSHCAPYGLSFPPLKIKPDGSFWGVVDNPGNWYLTLTGRFTSITAVTGTVSYRRCATDTFTVDIPAPVSTVPPCMLLSKAHAVNVISNGQPGENPTESFTGKAGQCHESFDHGTGSVSVAAGRLVSPAGCRRRWDGKNELVGPRPRRCRLLCGQRPARGPGCRLLRTWPHPGLSVG